MAARLRRPSPRAALVVLLGACAVVLLYSGRGLTFAYDEWDFVLFRRGWDLDTFLQPHNEHLSLVPVLVYKGLFLLGGLDSYWLFRLVVTALHLGCAVLVFALVRPRVGAWPGVLAAGLILFMGRAWEDILWPFQIGYLTSVAAGLGALIALDAPGRRRDAVASALLGLGLASSSLGIPLALGAGVELVAQRRGLRRLWVVGVPLALYAVWYLGYGRGALQASNLPAVLDWTRDAAAASVGAIAGQTLDWGRPLAVLAVALLARRLSRRGALTPRFAGLATALVAFWVLTALARADQVPPEQSRYLYLAAVLILLLAAELAAGTVLAHESTIVAMVLVALAVGFGLVVLREQVRFLRGVDHIVTAELSAMELARNRIAPDFHPEGPRAPTIVASQYFAAVRDLHSSPALPPGELPRAGGEARTQADRVLIAANRIGLEAGSAPPVAAPPVAVEGVQGATARQARGCVAFAPTGPEPFSADLILPAGGVAVTARTVPVTVLLRRFADFYGAPLGALPPRTTRLVRPPRDASTAPWRLRVQGRGPARACALP